MSRRDNGGPAFPQPYHLGADGLLTCPWDGWGTGGISVRDHFAGQALQALLTRGWDGEDPLLGQSYAESAYAFADEMLAERDKEQT